MIEGSVAYEGHPRWLRAAANRGLGDGLQLGILYWHARFAPLHFTQAAPAKYGYAERGQRYLRRKHKLHFQFGDYRGMRRGEGGKVRDLWPLQYTGVAKAQLIRYMQATAKVTGGVGVAKGSFKAPRYFWMNPAGHPDKAAELMRTLPPETAEMLEQVTPTIVRETRAAEHRRESRRKL